MKNDVLNNVLAFYTWLCWVVCFLCAIFLFFHLKKLKKKVTWNAEDHYLPTPTVASSLSWYPEGRPGETTSQLNRAEQFWLDCVSTHCRGSASGFLEERNKLHWQLREQSLFLLVSSGKTQQREGKIDGRFLTISVLDVIKSTEHIN